MRILKGRRVVSRERLRHLARGDAIVAEAQEMARRIVEEARGAAAAEREEARRAGAEEGRAEAAGMICKAAALEERFLRGRERRVVELALDIAARIVAGARRADPAAVEEACREALECAGGAGRVRLRVSPADAAAAEKIIEEEAARTGARPVQLVRDESIGDGGCVVETDDAVIDATVETRLAAVRKALLGE